ncbi:hypothetical protein KAT24_01095 [Candidatus Pacearchaeota archaeon]|nr:hypothetical protein [Candidatus Pacearchaeota archaeon]
MLKALVKNIGRKITLVTLVGSLLLGSGCATYKSKQSPVYEYAIEKGLETQTAKELEEKLNPALEDNEKEFIDVISSYPKKLQEVCADSDILNNKHISKKELKNTKKATLEGIVNPKEIYAVLANGFDDERGYAITDVLFFYKMFKNNHVEDENITLLLYNKLHEDYTNTPLQEQFKLNPMFISEEPMVFTEKEILQKNLLQFLREKNSKINQKIKEYASLTKDEITIDSSEVTGEKFLQSIKNLKSDYNDKAYIFYIAHGDYSKKEDRGKAEFSGEVITDIDLNEAISNIEYERLIVIGSSCYSSGLLKNLNKPKKIKNTLAIASAGVEEMAPANVPINFIIKYEKYKKISEIINENLYPKITTIPFYFDTEKTECPWLDEPFIEPQERI